MSDHQTNRIICQADMASFAARTLANRGIHVETILLGGARPVIWISAGAAAHRLRHAMYKRERIHGELHCTYVANELGCSIRWRATERPDPVPPRPTRRLADGVAA